MENEIICKHCGSGGLLKYGTYKGAQRYWCKGCKRKIKADDTTFHMKTPANQVTSAVNSYYEGMSIKAIRRHLLQEHDNAPSTATIYEWIQKYTQGGSTLYSRKRVKGTRVVGRYGRGG